MNKMIKDRITFSLNDGISMKYSSKKKKKGNSFDIDAKIVHVLLTRKI